MGDASVGFFKGLSRIIRNAGKDEEFLHFLEQVQSLVSKILSLAMILVILIAVIDLGVLLVKELQNPSIGSFNEVLLELFGIFLNILIAIELLENITAYLRKHVVQVELVITTAIIAVARKLILLDFKKTDGTQLIGLGFGIIALAISYWIVHIMNINSHDKHH